MLDVTLVPTLVVHAGASMQLYVSDLLHALAGQDGVRAAVARPPFGGEEHAGWWRNHRLRYVDYPNWCRRLDADLYHVTDHGNAQLLLALPARRTVVTCHDLYPVAIARGQLRFSGQHPRLAMVPTALRLFLLRRAAAVVAISRHTLEELHGLLGIPYARLFLAYYGVAPVFFIERSADEVRAFRLRHGLDPENVHILHIGANDPRKNLPAVFRVVAALRERHGLAVQLVKAGTPFGPRERELSHRCGLDGQVIEVGALPPEEMTLLYRAADVLLYPSYHEGFCRPVAEAMACGTPVVASRCGAIPEVVGDDRLLFAPEDVEGMARHIAELVSSATLRDQIVGRGRDRVRRFTWEAHGQTVAEAYRAVARSAVRQTGHIREASRCASCK